MEKQYFDVMSDPIPEAVPIVVVDAVGIGPDTVHGFVTARGIGRPCFVVDWGYPGAITVWFENIAQFETDPSSPVYRYRGPTVAELRAAALIQLAQQDDEDSEAALLL